MAQREKATTITLNLLVDKPLGAIYVTLPVDARVADIPQALMNTGWRGFKDAFSKPPDSYRYFKVLPGIPVPEDGDEARCKDLITDDEGYQKLSAIRSFSKVFPEIDEIDDGDLQIVVLSEDWSEDKAQMKIQRAFASVSLAEYTARVITLHVDALDKWKQIDVVNGKNGITLLWETSPPVHNQILLDARERLRKPRIISDPLLMEGRHFKSLKDTLDTASCDSPFETRMASDPAISFNASLVTPEEIDAFDAAVRNFLNWAKEASGGSSMMKDVWVSAATIAPPLFAFASQRISRGRPTPETLDTGATASQNGLLRNEFSYKHGEEYGLSILIRTQTGLLSKYTPKPDFLLMGDHYFPVLLGEVVSDPFHESDRWRMLLQLAICCRLLSLVSEPRESSPVVVQAVYISKALIAEHYIAHARVPESGTDPLPLVEISREEFNLTTCKGVTEFLRTMYNSHGLAMDIDSVLKKHMATLRQTLHGAVQGLHVCSAASQKKSQKSQSSNGKGSKAETPKMNTIPEHTQTLASLGYHVHAHSETHPHISYATDPSHDEVVLKFLDKSSGDEGEIGTLQFLHSAPDDVDAALRNHIAPFTILLSTEQGSIIATPRGTPLDQWDRKMPVPVVLHVGQQLLEAVHFIHSRGVAHRDLKPANLIVRPHEGGAAGYWLELFVIDFSLARQVEGRRVQGHGFVGTEGHTAPEVDHDHSYSIIEADLWAVGYMIEEMILSNGGVQAAELELLRLACRQLMDPVPARRPSAGEVLDTLRVAVVRPTKGSQTTPREVNAGWPTGSSMLAVY